MRRSRLLVLGTMALLLVSGCAPEPAPTPSTSPSASPSPTPSAEPIVEPEAAFDVTCDDVAAELTALIGAPEDEVQEALGLDSASSWIPGPAQYMFQRAGGIACSVGTTDRSWEVVLVPDAKTLTEGAASRGGFQGEYLNCAPAADGGGCIFQIIEGDVLVTGDITDTAISEERRGELDDALRRLGAAANDSLREVEVPDSSIAGAECARLLTADELAAELGTEVFIVDTFGGWGIEAEVYHITNGSRICTYAESESEYSKMFLLTTTLPGGAWAFERIAGGTQVDIEGADAALSGIDAFGRSILDVRVGADWIRLTTFEDSGISDLNRLAAQIVGNHTAGRPAPR